MGSSASPEREVTREIIPPELDKLAEWLNDQKLYPPNQENHNLIIATFEAALRRMYTKYSGLVFSNHKLSDSGKLIYLPTRKFVELSPIEEALARAFFKKPKALISKHELINRAWPGDGTLDKNLRVHIYRLRSRMEKLGDNGIWTLEIENYRHRGYYLTNRGELQT